MPEAGIRRIDVASALALLGVTFFLFCTEQIAVRFWFAVAVTAAIVSFVALLSRRLLFASVFTSSFVAVVFLVSLEKQFTMNVGLHSYDLFFYLNVDTFEFLWGDYRRYVVVIFAAFAVVHNPGSVDVALRHDAALASGIGFDPGRCDCGRGSTRASSKR